MRIAAARHPSRRAAPPVSWSLRDIFILFALFRGFSEIRAGDVIICYLPRTPQAVIYYLGVGAHGAGYCLLYLYASLLVDLLPLMWRDTIVRSVYLK